MRIDIQAPKKCVECPMFNDKFYGQCKLDGRWFGKEDSFVAETRPNWCPIKEEERDVTVDNVIKGLTECSKRNGKCQYANNPCPYVDACRSGDYRALDKDALKVIYHLQDLLEHFKGFSDFLGDELEKKREPNTEIKANLGDKWIPCAKKLPEVGEDVILYFFDTYHTHPSWPRTNIKSAWICNVDEDHPKGQWAINGRLWDNVVIDIDDGISWMPMPKE